MGYLTDSSIVLNQTEGIISISQIFGIPYVIFVGSNCEDAHVPEASLQMDYSKGRATSQVERKPMPTSQGQDEGSIRRSIDEQERALPDGDLRLLSDKFVGKSRREEVCESDILYEIAKASFAHAQ